MQQYVQIAVMSYPDYSDEGQLFRPHKFSLLYVVRVLWLSEGVPKH